MSANQRPPGGGLHRIEATLFVGGVFAFAFVMLIFGTGLHPVVYLPLVAGWIVAGLTFGWWFDRHLVARSPDSKVPPISSRTRRQR